MTQDTPERPSVRRVALGLIDDYGSVTDDLLVAMTHTETTADVETIRETIDRLERNGTIYNASADATAPRWKVTRP